MYVYVFLLGLALAPQPLQTLYMRAKTLRTLRSADKRL